MMVTIQMEILKYQKFNLLKYQFVILQKIYKKLILISGLNKTKENFVLFYVIILPKYKQTLDILKIELII